MGQVDYDWVMQAIFRGPPCRERPRSLFMALKKGLVPQEYLRVALEIERGLEELPRRPKSAIPARSAYEDPSWHNVVRALDEDR